MAGQSKLLDPLCISCKDFQHPWTDHCASAAAGILLSATPYCLRVYTVVYAFSLLMRHRVPNLTDLKRTLLGIIQSTAFLVTNAYSFIMYNCLLRNMLGRYNFYTVAFVPCFLASFTAILVERPARRPLLTLYVANVATEALWKMAESRGWVRSISNGQTFIFGLSMSALLYIYRRGPTEDSIFNILRHFVGKEEAGPIVNNWDTLPGEQPAPPQNRPSVSFSTISDWVRVYSNFLNAKHASCRHNQSCIAYSISGGIKPFVIGVVLQVALKLVMNVSKVASGKMKWRKHIFDRSILPLGIFMGSFSFLYKLALIMRMRVPRLQDLWRTLTGILQSTAFLSMNGGLFIFSVCLLRQLLGRFYFPTVAFLPSFLSSWLSIAVERPERRTPLAMYVANVGIETVWKMLESRGLVRSLPNGQVLIMGLSLTALMYLYRVGLHKTVAKDATFKGLSVILGKEEEGPLKTPTVTTTQSSRQRPLNFQSISAYVQVYDRLRTAKHPSCPHRQGCAPYALYGGFEAVPGRPGSAGWTESYCSTYPRLLI
ncbi:GL22288 [Drosophila persimilis]|uniref:GL22288 n=1 Tax=Drosophila persimilis TaxID=7234 RepID=B4GFW8_DROPE|nr:GL22288 [Drosophila persimilis]